MKNLYIIIAMLSCFGGYAQLQNANWRFGNNAGLNFLPNPYNPQSVSSAIDAPEGCASVSDQQGNLLFYTNGLKVWNAANALMPNGSGLLGNESSTEAAVIVPKPGSNNYYIFTIDGITGLKKGLYYSEVNMAANDIISTVKNIPLKDHTGTVIDVLYGNNSEKLTSTRHANGVDYWVVTQIRDKIYSYLVSAAGVSLNPISSNAPVAIPTGDDESQIGVGAMKVGPIGKIMGIAYFDNAIVSPQSGAVAIGSFDQNTGFAIFSTSLIHPVNSPAYYGLEFSPTGDYIYFNAGNNLYRGISTSVTSTTSTLLGTPYTGSLQLALNGKIYVSNPTYSSPSYMDISVINQPDDPINPDIQANSVDIMYGSSGNGLPQWVHQHILECMENVTLTFPDLNFVPFTYSYQDYIITTNNYSVQPNQNISMRAGNYIQMEPDTYITPGSLFYAYIEDCSLDERPGGSNDVKRTFSVSNKTLVMYPNPSNGIVNIELAEGLLQHLQIVSLDGKTIVDKDMGKVAIYTFDIADYSKGIYMANIVTTDGKVYTEKLIVQ